jgi:hypothetical protein
VPVFELEQGAVLGGEPEPARGQHAQHVTVREERDIGLDPVDRLDHPVHAAAHVGRRLAARAAVAP